MKLSLNIIVLTLLSSTTFGQVQKTTADTFDLKFNRSQRILILRSDSTYTLRNSGCTNSQLYMGFWEKNKSQYHLTGFVKSSIDVYTELSYEKPSDSIVTFKVHDCYGNPIGGYYIYLYDQNLYPDTSSFDPRTNSKGILQIKDGKFMWFCTETDETNREDIRGSYSDLVFRRLPYNIKSVTIILCYPKNSTTLPTPDNFNYFMKEVFVRERTMLGQPDSKLKYRIR